MLGLVRVIAWLAPFAVAASVALLAAQLRTSGANTAGWLLLTASATIAGLSVMALLASAIVTQRFAKVARTLEAGGSPDARPMAVRGLPVERRLARAFNAAAVAFAQVEVRATRDRLTGVANRETLLSSLTTEVERANRYRQPLSVAFVDIDRFKGINDTYGHNSGDAVLRQVANIVAHNVRSSDFVGRYGGEEFMLILPATGPEEAAEVAEKLRGLVMQTPLTIAEGGTLRATISVGVAGDTGGELRLERLVADADAAMYSAKSLGRNQTYIFRAVNEERRVRRAPVDRQHRERATKLGEWANARTTEALASVLAPQPNHRGRPSDMIAALATGMASEMGLPDADIERIRFASLLHDVGKVALPQDILDKPGALTEFEWQAITEHPRIGQMVLEQATSLREAVPIVLHHHERYNGGGYPHGLAGRDIPLGARIVAVADAYHAMVHDRPYQESRSHAEALAELQRCAGTQFDPDVVALFCRIYSGGVPADGDQAVAGIVAASQAAPPDAPSPPPEEGRVTRLDERRQVS
jgi:diguanylate cyclase (GGDEF)-like protein